MTNWCWRCWRCCPCWPSEYDRPTGLHRCLIRIASTIPSQEWFHHVEAPFAAHRLHEKTICRMLKIILLFYKMLILQTVQMVCSPFGKFSCHSLCPISLIHCTLEAGALAGARASWTLGFGAVNGWAILNWYRRAQRWRGLAAAGGGVQIFTFLTIVFFISISWQQPV